MTKFYVVTFKGRPVTAEQIACRETGLVYEAKYDDTAFHTGRTIGRAQSNFVKQHGYSWQQWAKEGYGTKQVS